uniref:Uncharacterized protein n=1 Tax=Wuchereria bancrofti TaxID=6293 RepID=A0A1I8EPI0_WUCBA
MLAVFFYYRVCKTIWLSYCNQQLLLPMSDSSQLLLQMSDSQETRSYVVRLHNDSRHCRRQLMKFNRDRFQTICLTMTVIFCNFFLWAPFCVKQIVKKDEIASSFTLQYNYRFTTNQLRRIKLKRHSHLQMVIHFCVII